MPHSFDISFSGKIKEILNYIFSGKNFIGFHVEAYQAGEFLKKVKDSTGVPIVYSDYLVSESLPQTKSRAFIVSDGDGKTITTGGSTELDDSVSLVKAQGELLERISSILPLEHIRKHGFDLKQNSSIVEKKVFAKRFLGFGWRKVSVAHIYYKLSYLFFNRNGRKYSLPKKQISTNGGAGHFDYSKAVLGGLLEVVQRDAFLVHWLNTISPTKIDVVGYVGNSKEIKRIQENIKKYSLRCYFLDITSDIAVPTCACVLVCDYPTGKKVSLGAASGFHSGSILQTAFTEAISVMNFTQKNTPFILPENYKPFSDPALGRDERLSLYVNETMFEKFKFFVSSKKSISVENFMTLDGKIDLENKGTKEYLKYLKNIFREKYENNKSYDVLVYQIKNDLLDEFGYKVVRVLCDAMYYLYLNENFGDPEHPRLKEFVKNKGLESVAKLNIWPHPFP